MVEVTMEVLSPCKRRKVNGHVSYGEDKEELFTASSPENYPSPATSACSGAGSVELRSGDLKVESCRTEASKLNNRQLISESTPSIELSTTTEDLKSLTETKKPSPTIFGQKIPAAEIEEFFTAAEKYEQKRFIQKYNYDIVKDVPLEGNYQWIRLKP